MRTPRRRRGVARREPPNIWLGHLIAARCVGVQVLQFTIKSGALLFCVAELVLPTTARRRSGLRDPGGMEVLASLFMLAGLRDCWMVRSAPGNTRATGQLTQFGQKPSGAARYSRQPVSLPARIW
jgi:hypothetical protein